MSKKIITIIIAAAMIASSAINAFAVGNTSNNSFNVSAQTYTTMSATDKEKFINDNLDVKLQHMSSLVTLTANGINIPQRCILRIYTSGKSVGRSRYRIEGFGAGYYIFKQNNVK